MNLKTQITLKDLVSSRDAFCNALTQAAEGSTIEIVLNEGGNQPIASITTNDENTMPSAQWSIADETLDYKLALSLAFKHKDTIGFRIPTTSKGVIIVLEQKR